MTEREVSGLTGRRLECIELVGRGFTSKEIARKLDISPRTVDHHISAALEKLGVNNRLAAAALIARADDEPEAIASHGSSQNFVSIKPFMLSDENAAGEMSALLFTAPLRDAASPEVEAQPAEIQQAFFPPLGGRLNQASKRQRVVWILRVATMTLMTVCLLILSVTVLSGLASLLG